MKLYDVWIDIKCWIYWIYHIILIQFESVGWWLEDLCRRRNERKRSVRTTSADEK